MGESAAIELTQIYIVVLCPRRVNRGSELHEIVQCHLDLRDCCGFQRENKQFHGMHEERIIGVDLNGLLKVHSLATEYPCLYALFDYRQSYWSSITPG